ncbi:MAG: LytTR family DNA-binding domain-containing protein [Ginsengibacter sp.]
MSSAIAGTKYKDVKLFLWLIPSINVINYYLTYVTFSPFWRVLVTFTIDTVQGYIAWLIVRSIILWLDKKISYHVNPIRRILVQVTLTLLGGCASIIILTEFVNWLATSKPVPRSFYTVDILIISIWFFVVNGIYVGLYYYHQWQESEEKRKKETEIKTSGFRVSTPKKDLIFSFEEIGGFYIDGDYSVVVTTERKKFLVNLSLDKVEKTLPGSSFFRLNRQYIVNRQVVSGYEKAENGKLNVLLKNTDHLPAAIPVSRTRAAGFKSWLHPS